LYKFFSYLDINLYFSEYNKLIMYRILYSLFFLSIYHTAFSQTYPLPYIESFDTFTANRPLNGSANYTATSHVYVTARGVVGNCAEFQMSDTSVSTTDTITSPVIGPLTANTVTSFYFRVVNVASIGVTHYQMTPSDQAVIYVGGLNGTGSLYLSQYTIDSADQNPTGSYIKVTVAAPSFVNGLTGRFKIVTLNPDRHNWRLEFDSLEVRDTISTSIPPILTDSVTEVTCRGLSTGAIKVIASGGTPPYTYLWSYGSDSTSQIDSLAAGVYTVTVTDSLGATAILTDTVRQPAFALLLDSLTKTSVVCYGSSTGSATIYASGGTMPLHYDWSTTPAETTDSAVGLAAGNYNVTVTDASGCDLTASVRITQPSVPLITTTSTTQATSGNNGTATVIANGGTSPFSYIWSTSPVQTTAIATGLAPGLYEVTVTDGIGCSLYDTVFVAFPNGIIGVGDYSLSVYPNPAADQVYISIIGVSSKSIIASIADMSGRVILIQDASQGNINTSSISAGIYILKVSADDRYYTDKLVIRR
jgi:hypothetical protein